MTHLHLTHALAALLLKTALFALAGFAFCLLVAWLVVRVAGEYDDVE